MPDPAITVTFQPTEADHYRALRDATTRNRLYRAMMLIWLVAPLILIGVTVRAGFTLPQAIFRNVFWIIVVPLFAAILPMTLRVQAWLARRRNAAAGMETQVFTFDDQGVRLGSAAKQSELRWSEIHRIVETRHSLLLYVSSRAAAYFPISAVESDGTLLALRRLMRSQLGDRAELRTSP